MQPIIKTEKLGVIYDLGEPSETRSLDAVDIEIFPGEYIILFGPSGSGKSTLLYTIMGIQKPTSGDILIKGQSMIELSPMEQVRFRQSVLGIVFQAYYLIPSLSVVDNVILPQIFSGANFANRREVAMALLDRFGIGAQADKLPSSLSGGQQQRVAISRALVNDPEIVLADEPVGNLDSVSADRVMQLLRDVNEKDKKTVILVTHDPRLLPYAHRVYYMRDGKVDRVTTNFDKKQVFEMREDGMTRAEIMKRVPTELEHLAQLFPHLTEHELRAKALAAHLVEDLTFDQVEKIERAIGKLMAGELGENDFYQILDRGERGGGVGLYEPRARDYTLRVKRILDEARDYRARLERANIDAEFDGAILSLRSYLVGEYGGKVSAEQIKNLDGAIRDRATGVLNHASFEEKLCAYLADGGVGLGRGTARKMSEKLEILLTESRDGQNI